LGARALLARLGVFGRTGDRTYLASMLEATGMRGSNHGGFQSMEGFEFFKSSNILTKKEICWTFPQRGRGVDVSGCPTGDTRNVPSKTLGSAVLRSRR